MADKKGGGPPDTSALFADLSKYETTQDFDKALKVCNKILNLTPSDSMAFHCKMVCLMQLSRFEDALKQISDTHFSELDLVFEEAYCLYRLNKPNESLAVLDKNSKPKSESDRVKELRAQIYYRLERYEEAYAIYRDILKNSSDDFEQERLTNLQAAGVFVDNSEVMEEDETYEMCYNRGCQLLAGGQYAEAEVALKKAEQMCEAVMKEEEADEEEIERETGIIRVQAGFAIQMQGGRDREAQSIYNSVLKHKPSDIGLVAVASNNLLTLNKDQNIFDSKKRIKAATVDGLEHKLTTSHRASIARNNALLAMYTNQVDLCKSLVADLSKNFDDVDEEDKDMIVAGVLARSGRVKEAVDLLLKGNKSKDLNRILIAAQVQLEKGDVHAAIATLEALPASTKHRTGLLSTLVALYLAADQRGEAGKLLKDAVGSSQKNKASADMALVWRKTAEFHLKGDEPSVAAKSLEELLKMNPKDKTTLAQLVLAYSKFNLKKAMETSKKLPDFASKAVDVDALEASASLSRYGKRTGPGGMKPASPKPQTPEEKAAAAEDVDKKKKKKKRKKRLPKEFDPKVDPDPERWLPRRERTGYRRTRKERRKGEKFTGAQGTAAGQSENFDYSKKTSSATGATPKSPAVAQEKPQGPRQQQRKNQSKGKKKGGKNRF